MECRICGNYELKVFLSLGRTGLANNLLTAEELGNREETYPLDVSLCNKCKLVQLTTIVPPEKMFSNYLYVTSTTQTFKEHFGMMANYLTKMFGLGNKSLVVDIGSNDGLLLKGFKHNGVSVVGVEPAKNIATIANNDGIDTINAFFDEEVVNRILEMYGKADVVTANNVFAHIHNISKLVNNIKKLLKNNGVYIFEVHYLCSLMEKLTFDAIYHEHLSYYTLTPLVKFFKMHDMEIFRVELVSSHGGSLRVFVQKQNGQHKIDHSVIQMLEQEKKKGIGSYETYEKFAKKVYEFRKELTYLLQGIKENGKTIAGYGFPAKATTLLTFCGVGKDTIRYIVDDNPMKQGRFTPVGHIPIVGSRRLDEEKPDYIMILAWNFADEIMRKLDSYKKSGVKFIIPFPKPKIVQ